MTLKNKVAIVGADETDEIGIVPNMTPIMMHAQAARNALRDAGIDKSEVDGVFTAGVGGWPARSSASTWASSRSTRTAR